MPININTRGEEVEDNGTVITPATQSVDDIIAQEFGEENSSSFGLSDVGELASLAANSATMGVAPLVVGMFSKDKKNEILNYLEKSREHQGALGTAAEIAGALAVPIPGLGATAAAARGATAGAKLLRLGKVAAKGSALGGAGSLLGYSGNVAGGQWNLADAAKATAVGAGLGAGAGLAGDKLGRMLAERANAARFSAGGGTAGSIRKLGASGPGATPKAIEIKANKVADTAEKRGWIGEAGQTVADSADKAAKTANWAQQKMENIIQQHGTASIPADQVVKDLEAALGAQLARSKGGNAQLSKANKESMEMILSNVKESLGYTPARQSNVLNAAGQPVVIPASWKVPSLTVQDVQNLKGNLKDMVWGPLGSNVPANSVAKQAQAKAAMFMSDLENNLIRQVDPASADKFAKMKELTHHAKLWEAMGRTSSVSEKGLLEMGTGRGLRSIPDTAIVHMMLTPIRKATGGLVGGPVSSQVIAGRYFGSGMNSNNLLAARNAVSRIRGGTPEGVLEKPLSALLQRGKPTLRAGQAIGVGSSRFD